MRKPFLLLASFSVAHLLMIITPDPLRADITTNWQVDLYSQYDYVSGTNVPLSVPSSFVVSITFPQTPTSFIDYGLETQTYFGALGDSHIFSPLNAHVGNDPFGTGIDPNAGFTIAGTSDYASNFLEEFAILANTFHPSGSSYWNHSFSLRANRSTPSRGGTGTEDYAFTESILAVYLDELMTSPSSFSVSFGESWELWDGTTYLAGTGWNGTFTLLSVPEPAGVPMVAATTLAVFMVTGIRRWRQSRVRLNAHPAINSRG